MLGCYLIWGLVPLYWKQLAHVNALELIAHRHVWSLVFVLFLVSQQGELRLLFTALRRPRAIFLNLVSALLLTGNWLIYVWGVNTGHIVEASLGYYLAPLVNVASGRFLLHEHLRLRQWLAITFAALGVAVLVIQMGRLPWIALGLAGTWGGYSLMRKKSSLGALTGLAAETLLLAPFAAAYLLWRENAGVGALGHVGTTTTVLILSSGVITAIPLIMFAYGAKRIRLTTLGVLQYLTPSLQFSLGVWVYGEAFPRERLFAFGFIWAALVLYAVDTVVTQRRAAAAVVAPVTEEPAG